MKEDVPVTQVTLWLDDAIVLYDWLMSVDLNSIPITHPAQKQALADLLSRLEQDSPVEGVSVEDIARAQSAVAAHMGW